MQLVRLDLFFFLAGQESTMLLAGRCWRNVPTRMAAMLTLSLWAIAAARPLQVVFSAECNHLFDWHTAALVYSMELSGFGKTANLSRLLACAGKEREAYSEANLALAPHTFVHRNMRDDPLVDEKGCGPDRCKVHSELHRHRSSSDHTP